MWKGTIHSPIQRYLSFALFTSLTLTLKQNWKGERYKAKSDILPQYQWLYRMYIYFLFSGTDAVCFRYHSFSSVHTYLPPALRWFVNKKSNNFVCRGKSIIGFSYWKFDFKILQLMTPLDEFKLLALEFSAIWSWNICLTAAVTCF